ncbi:AAA family ATPase [Candidatus Desantisbacteria bacterium CG_4_10_14_0_8_um_filter_48_22]|uniref:AAA family ATPase n=1 Tax=Candidatus Desantisbacteria bacterium CG_4_10_14_0_8_um_filter_48_22 TaxID=1974543 RepID=A0A2M7SBU7_9BACT|nr:MAG: AAA family ATPase [Candidatus Desantisbacteria bacterium CG1_02_49_89]PIV54764.1 MAG: AAA family ATPase [Candidatus Desantisbacteria bacterium CG02_land_8_20_14_3_00_49_13]PIZ16995.1 MAG: AAA family ATPase [Candidatus Desantisbacteria bacterium CG_4_10_14_0_8_um_filter_48_22]PJB27652.1 MAG: AAA family ATPase [Candidatus Desantisbacteria bacterium CG_4_9_14_3_um_filter_50_7]
MVDSEAKIVEEVKQAKEKMLKEISKVIIGQKEVVEEMLIGLFSRGHCLVVGVPGLAKTLLVRTIARVMNLKFNRIQFTPDLMPSDITGTEVIEEDRSTGKRSYRFIQGPVFANVLLADEINRTPPKTQAALLEAMQEYRVTVGGVTYPIQEPFFVLATQNPIEQEGTYPLPEAQLDRFMFNIKIDYPSEADERKIITATTSEDVTELDVVMKGEEILRMQKLVRKLPVSEHVVNYTLAITRSTRPNQPDCPDFVKKWVSWGAGPRAAQCLVIGAKARAIMEGRCNISCKDVQAVAHSALRHRIIANFNAEADGITSDSIIDKLLETIKEPEYK